MRGWVAFRLSALLGQRIEGAE